MHKFICNREAHERPEKVKSLVLQRTHVVDNDVVRSVTTLNEIVDDIRDHLTCRDFALEVLLENGQMNLLREASPLDGSRLEVVDHLDRGFSSIQSQISSLNIE